MQDVENNMDELFRKAAGNYPLRASKDDWDKISPLLLTSPVIAGKHKKSTIKKNSPSLFFFFVFLFIAGIATKDSLSSLTAENISKQPGKEMKQVTIENAGSRSHEVKNNNRGDVKNDANNVLQQNNQQVKGSRTRQAKNKFGFKKQLPVSEVVTETRIPGNGLMTNENIAQEAVSNNGTSANNWVIKDTGSTQVKAGTVTADKINMSLPASGKLAAVADKIKEAIVIKTNNFKKKNRIYYGIQFGPSFNQVKSQGLEKAGYDAGLLAGYQFNRKISVETGLLFEKKYYFSDGKYFNMEKAAASMPVGMKILSLEGSCSVFEIPFKLKYNMPGKSSGHFYVTAGISTYIITNEYNKYHAVINGAQQNVTGTYNITSPYVAAVFDASVGFDKSIGKSTRIRIEPYFQIPFRGIGVGSLQVMTAGLHIGLMRAKK